MQKEKDIKNAVHVFNDNAELYVEKYMDLATYKGALDFFIDLLPGNADLLDVACGPGNITRYLLSKSKELKILGVDLAEKMLLEAKKFNPEADFKLLDGRNIKSLNKKYDGIISGFFSPYLSKEELKQFITDVSSCLQLNGIFYLSTMEDDYGKSRIQKSSTGAYSLHMYFHETNYIRAFASESGLKFLKKYEYDIDGKEEMIDIAMIFQKI